MPDGAPTADLGAQLNAELTSIIKCPYPPSLSPLSHLLARADLPTIRASIHHRSPCALAALAKIVRDALPLTAYTLPVLHRLCHAPEFRDQLLIRYPGLLNGLLEKAVSSKQDFNDLGELCVLLLSYPLPEAIPLPAAAQSFLLHVFDKASQNPSSDALKSVYRMLNGACPHLYRLLPSAARRRFDTELCRILQNNVSGESAMLLLWLCGIVIIVEHPEGIQPAHASDTSRQPVSTQTLVQQWLTPSGQKLFGSTKDLYKNIQMTCLNILWLLKAPVVVDDDQVTEGLRIASRIMQCIDVDIKDSWIKHEKGALLFDKCRSRIEESASGPIIQLEALSFFGQLSGSKKLPQSIVTQYSSCVFDAVCTAEPASVSELLSVSLPKFGAHIPEIQALFSSVLDACAEQPSPRHMSNLVSFVDELTAATLSSSILRGNVLRGLSSKTLQDKIWRLVRLDPNQQAVCTHVGSIHRQLITATIASLITIILAAEPGEPTLTQTLTMSLVKAQRYLPLVAGACPIASETPKNTPISLFQAANTQNTGQHLEDWSTRLESELQSQGKYQRDAILRSVAQICTDLETRCNTVEEPLRREKEKSTKLEEQIRSLNDEVESLRIQNEDSVDQLEGLEKELEDLREDQGRLQEENAAVTQEKEQAQSRAKELETLLEESKSNANEALKAAQESFSAKELTLESRVLQYEENSRAHDSQIQQLNDTISELRQSGAQLEKDHSTLAKEYESLQRRYQDMEETLQHERSNAANQNDGVARLEIRVSEYRRLLEEKEAELEEALKNVDTLQRMHRELQETSEAKLKDLAAQHTSDIHALNEKAEHVCKSLEDQLQNALEDYQQEQHDHEKSHQQIEQLQEIIPHLESRIQELEDFCKEQEDELEERRAIHKNVLAHFGVSSQQPLAIRSASRSYKDIAATTTTREPRTQRRRKSAFITPQDITPMADSTTEDTAEASFESSSKANIPAPKRLKPRPTFKVPTMLTPYAQKPNLVSKSISGRTSPSKRSALRQMSPNRRHTVGASTAEQGDNDITDASASMEKRGESFQDIEYADFDTDEEFLSDTPLTPGFMAGTGRIPNEDETSTSEL
ncbi:hypothetical protein J3E72DRAFT_244379 [Bipolaris maydis]|nr:hypothetical protein J3E72DRAFT_244379 [Bipolaris maydis]KAJ6280559.1 hypothetical protein J3E71DRAFT_220358 [Bipolaris maydis]